MLKNDQVIEYQNILDPNKIFVILTVHVTDEGSNSEFEGYNLKDFVFQ